MDKKIIFITGASRGIGRSIALLFAKQGYHICLNCNRSETELAQVQQEILMLPNGSCEMLIGDAGNPNDIRQMFAQLTTSGSHPDILVNNAGASHIGLLSDMSDEQWNHIIQTNLSSVFYCSRAVIPGMVSRKQGRIINISSMWGLSGASCEAAYSASKAGVHGLTQALAKELAPSNIQVNAIACGVIDTKMNHQLTANERRGLEETIPAGRFGSPDEVAQLVWSLAHESSYLTGQIISLNGGYI